MFDSIVTTFEAYMKGNTSPSTPSLAQAQVFHSTTTLTVTTVSFHTVDLIHRPDELLLQLSTMVLSLPNDNHSTPGGTLQTRAPLRYCTDHLLPFQSNGGDQRS